MDTRRAVEAYLSAVRTHGDWAALLADDVAFTSYTSPVKRLAGKAAFLSATQRFYGGIDALEVGRILVDGPQACALTCYQLTRADGKRVESDVAELFEVRDGRIASLAIFFDSATFAK